jgi:acetyltransferase-like isoleucine patch superfamily enzyme
MIKDHRPYWLKRAYQAFEKKYTSHLLAPQLESLGPGHQMMKPWNIKIHGKHISIGKNVHVVTAKDRHVTFSTWTLMDHQGHIELGDNVLVCPGTRFDSASRISIGNNCMFAAGAYITDADWHDIYDRTQSVGSTRPITLFDNVWIGDGAIVCKGVSIGTNSVIGAGSVVTSDIPANVIAAGNPARVVKPLDPDKPLTTREQLFANPALLNEELEKVDRYLLQPNSIFGYLRSRFFPRRGD